MVPLYAARIEDLGPGEFVEVDCSACSYTAQFVREADKLPLRAKLASAFLERLGRSPRGKDARSQESCAVSRLRFFRAGCPFNQVGKKMSPETADHAASERMPHFQMSCENQLNPQQHHRLQEQPHTSHQIVRISDV